MVFLECITSLLNATNDKAKQYTNTTRQTGQISNQTSKTPHRASLVENYNKSDMDELWNIFKEGLLTSVNKHKRKSQTT